MVHKSWPEEPKVPLWLLLVQTLAPDWWTIDLRQLSSETVGEIYRSIVAFVLCVRSVSLLYV
jgi:hypothetical protein